VRPGGWRPQRAIKDKTLKPAEVRGQLLTLLVGCTDERLEGMTATSLAGMYRVPPLEIAQMLADERARRFA
jgi:hypothetical protein